MGSWASECPSALLELPSPNRTRIKMLTSSSFWVLWTKIQQIITQIKGPQTQVEFPTLKKEG
jgi:hypothetical protein